MVGRLFLSYDADSYLRIEDMPWAFLEFLSALGVPKAMRERCVDLGKLNASKSIPLWNKRLRRRVLEAEREVCDEFEYHG